MPNSQAFIDHDEVGRLKTVLKRIDRADYFNWILEKSHTRSANGKLVSLDLSWLGIRSLPSNFFKGLNYLREVRFDNNPRCNFEDNSLVHKPLRTLKLRYCQLNSFPTHAIPESNDLFILELNNNPLKRLENDNFSNLTELSELNLSDTQLSRLSRHAFVGLKTLSLLRLDNNFLSEIPANVFKALTNLEELSIKNNNLGILHDQSFRGLRRLKEINLSSNTLKKLPKKVFEDLILLETLNLVNNEIAEISGQLQQLSKLTSVSLQMNNIEELPKDLFKNSTSIVQVSFEDNNISTIGDDTFCNLSNLEFLNMRNNPLSLDVALKLPEFTKFDYSPIIKSLSKEELHQKIINNPTHHSFISQAIVTDNLLPKTRAFLRLNGYE